MRHPETVVPASRMPGLCGAVLFILVCVYWTGAAADSPPASLHVTAGHTQGVITLDGRLDEPDWQRAEIANLTQQSPVPGGPTPYLTEVRALRDDSHLYFGIVCHDPQPQDIAVHTLRRDADQTGDDSVTLVLDTFGDQRTAYVFQVNAGGARLDGLIGPGDEAPNADWDGIWDARVQRTADGWTAEIVIPSRTLHFDPALDHWGFNVERFVALGRITLRLSGIALNANLYDLHRAAILEGILDLKQGTGLAFVPYASIDKETEDGIHKHVGGDLRYDITPALSAIFTVHTDFAEAEADTRQINLTPFSLFQPEKRAFFAENANLFSFATALDTTNFLPFYSRQIGLVNGTQVPLDVGIKTVGQVGDYSVGVLGIETGNSAVAPSTDLSVARFADNVTPALRLGVLATHGDPTGQSTNSFTGVDGVWQTEDLFGDRNLLVSSWAARTDTPGMSGMDSAFGVHIDYPNDLWDDYLDYNVFGGAFNPALGFLPRPATRQYDVYVSYNPRPEAGLFDWARQFFYEAAYHQVNGLDGVTQTRRLFLAPFNVRTESGEHFEVDWIPEYERLIAPFDVAQGVTLPIGAYSFNRTHLEFQTADARAWKTGAMFETGGYYDGHLVTFQPFVNLSLWDGRLETALSHETDIGHLPQGDFVERIWGLQLTYSFTPDIEVTTFNQYDTVSRSTGVNAVFRWTITPGRDFFIVWNRGPTTLPSNTTLPTGPTESLVIVKLRWTLQE